MRGPSSPEAGTPDRPVLKGNRPGRRPTSPRSILRQRAPRHITRVGEARRSVQEKCPGRERCRPVQRVNSHPHEVLHAPGPLSSPARKGRTQKNGARQGFCDGNRATAQGPARGEYCRECGKRNKPVPSGRRKNWPYELCLPQLCCLARRKARRRVLGLRPEFWL